MSAMSQQLQIGEDIVPVPELEPKADNDRAVGSHPVKATVRMLATLLLVPFLLAVALLGFLVVLADFTWFRLRETRYGHPHPKGLWEF
jgi:hypothetical protein